MPHFAQNKRTLGRYRWVTPSAIRRSSMHYSRPCQRVNYPSNAVDTANGDAAAIRTDDSRDKNGRLITGSSPQLEARTGRVPTVSLAVQSRCWPRRLQRTTLRVTRVANA